MKWLLVLALAATSGCGIELRQRLRGVRQVIQEARENGAYRCAPRELAMAESHADFTEEELDYGNHLGARDELQIAETSSRLAFERSPRDKCTEQAKPKVEVKRLDSDGDGLFDDVDRCPKEPEDKDDFEDEDGCPDPDNDKDGVLDGDDRCPRKAGPKENQGCPDRDKDKDGTVDRLDRCPDDPGPPELRGCPDRDRDLVADLDDKCPDVPGPPDNQGCPAYKLIVVRDDKIELRQKVHFATNKATIFPDSFPMLNEIAEVFVKRSTMEVRIEGHTDSRASLKYNMKLSQDRANAVKRYLEARGVSTGRMAAVGYGPTQPVGDNRTAVGREANRRVEFFITRQ